MAKATVSQCKVVHAELMALYNNRDDYNQMSHKDKINLTKAVKKKEAELSKIATDLYKQGVRTITLG